MVAGAGGMYTAAIEIARLENEISRRRAVRRARKEGMRERLARYEHYEHEQIPHRVDFECFHLCGECGYLSRRPDGPCPACKAGGAWLDLGDHLVADSVRDAELRERLKVPWWVRALLGTGLALAVLLVAVATSALWWATIGAICVAVVVFSVGARPLSVMLLRTRENKPFRWHLPMPLSEGTAPVRQRKGPIEADEGTLLHAPFTGRACVAYQACVLFDTPHDARPPEWVIQESYGVDFRIDGADMDGEHVLVHTPLLEVELDDAEAAGLDLARYLRERGLFVSDGEYELYEAVVEPGQKVRVELLVNPSTTVIEPA